MTLIVKQDEDHVAYVPTTDNQNRPSDIDSIEAQQLLQQVCDDPDAEAELLEDLLSTIHNNLKANNYSKDQGPKKVRRLLPVYIG